MFSTTWRSCLLYILILMLTLGCQPHDLAHSTSLPQEIIGKNQLVPMDPTFTPSHIIPAIGLLKVGCTVFYADNGLAFTAGHCLQPRKSEFFLEEANCNFSRFEANWGILRQQDSRQAPWHSQCETIRGSMFNHSFDFAALRLMSPPASALKIAKKFPTPGDKISIVSHPKLRPLEWSDYCHVLSITEESGNKQFSYTCDTQQGSSGAPIFNEHWQVVGIHSHYNEELNVNIGTSIKKVLNKLLSSKHS